MLAFTEQWVMTNHVSGAAVKGKTMIFQPFLAVLIALHHINEELTFMLSLLVYLMLNVVYL